MSITNTTHPQDGMVCAVCAFCDRVSETVPVNGRGEPSLFDLEQGWSVAPYSPTFEHADGSTGSLYTCPECCRRLEAGELLSPTAERAAARRQ